MLTAAGWVGFSIMIVGIILVVLGVVFYEVNLINNKPISWWIWTLLILGIIMTIVGLIVTMIFLRHPPSSKETPLTVFPMLDEESN